MEGTDWIALAAANLNITTYDLVTTDEKVAVQDPP
jgi:hypothetical protein